MDCFYVQVERLIEPSLRNQPAVVLQYNPYGDLKSVKPDENRVGYQNGSSIAVSYEARAKGVKRGMRGSEMIALCPNLMMVTVPTAHGKADLTIYRDAGNKVVEAIKNKVKGCVIEKASIDEVYLDITEEAHHRLKIMDFGSEILPFSKHNQLAGQDTKETAMSKHALRQGLSAEQTTSSSTVVG